MKRANTVLFSILMIVSSLAGCIGEQEIDASEYEDQIAELEEMLEVQNQTISQRESTIDGLEDGLSNATQVFQDHVEGIAILEAYRDSLLIQLENSNNTSDELILQLESANDSIIAMQSQIMSIESLRDSLSSMLNSSNSTIDELEDLLESANATILELQQNTENNSSTEWSNYLAGADLSGADLTGCLLVGASLYGANLFGAYLGGVELSDADMRQADLRNSNLLYANLTNANLWQAQLNGVHWENTTCPDGTNSDDNGGTCVNNLDYW